MAGKIIADTIEASGSQLSLNVGNVTILTVSSTGLTLIPTNNVNVNLTNSNSVTLTTANITTANITTANITGVATFSAGSVGTPSITTSGDTNTGLYFPTADTIAFSEGGAEAMRIDASGRVGIGTASPDSAGALTTEVNGNSLNISRTSSTTNRAGWVSQNTAETIRLFSEVYGASATNTGFGLTLGGYSVIQSSGTASNGLVVGTGTADPLIFGTNDTERARIDSGGNVLIATTSSTIGGDGGRLLIDAGASSLALLANRTGDGNMVRWYRTNVQVGSIGVTASATSYNTSSDYRLKQNIAPMTGALAKVALLKPVTYKWKADESDGQGFIAHELAEVVPDCVTGEKDALKEDGNPDYQGVDTSFLVATLTAAIQELKVIVDAQAVEIAALKAK